MGQRAGSKWSVVFSDVSMLAVPLLAFQIVASSWSVCTNSLHLDFSTPFNRLFSFAVDVACSCVFVKFWILYIYSKFLFMIFLKPVFAHAPCSHRLCPILVSILSLLETICVAFFCDLFLFLHILFTLGLCVYAIFSFAIFAIPWAIVRLHPHWKREINASCYSFRSRLNFSLSLNSLFASFFLSSCYYLLCECKDVVFSQDALEILCRYLCCFCTSSKFHVHDIFCISCVPVEQQTKTEQKHKLTTSEKFCFLFLYSFSRYPAVPFSLSFSCSHHSLKYVSSLAPCLATYPFAFSTIYTFQFHFISRTRFLSFDLFLRFVAFALASCCCRCCCLSHSRQLNGYGVYVLILHFYTCCSFICCIRAYAFCP